jgi:hypothetical protein
MSGFKGLTEIKCNSVIDIARRMPELSIAKVCVFLLSESEWKAAEPYAELV